MENDFSFIQNLVDCLSGLQVHLVPGTQEGHLSLVSDLFQDMLPSAQAELVIRRTLRSSEPGRVYHMYSPLGLRFAMYRFVHTGQLLVLGPCRDESASDKEITAYLRSAGLDGVDVQRLLSYCRQQPEMSYARLYSLAQLLVSQLEGLEFPLSQQELNLTWTETERQELWDTSDFTELDQIREIETRYEASAVMTEAVKHGNLSLAYRYIQKMGNIPQGLVRTENSLRNAQNLCITMNTQLRHALEEDGFHPYRLDQLSGGIARQIEKLKTQTAVNNYFIQILRQYCELAQEKSHAGLGPFARLAVAYIHTHLSDNLTVKDAAKALLVNADYLSHRFRQEVGLPFITYVNRERCRQAASILQRTELQVQQVSAAVGYNNTSYFARQFVIFYGCTPSAYRAKNSPLHMAGI